MRMKQRNTTDWNLYYLEMVQGHDDDKVNVLYGKIKQLNVTVCQRIYVGYLMHLSVVNQSSYVQYKMQLVKITFNIYI